MLNGLKTALQATGYAFTEGIWVSPPKTGDYGTFYAAGQDALAVDEDSGAETCLTGYVDFFTKSDGAVQKTAIENALRTLRIGWKLESIQVESETGFTHFEWRWWDYAKDTV